MAFRSATTFALILSGLAAAGYPHAAQAADFRAYLATASQGTGDCSSAANACGTLTTALNNTYDDGTIVCVSGGITSGAVTITKSVTIDCAANGHFVSQLTINAPGKRVKIAGLTVNAGASGNPVLVINSAASVIVERLNIGVPYGNGPCISDTRAGPARLVIKDSSIYECGGVGILIAPQSGTLTAAFDGVSVTNSGYGLAVGTGGRVMIVRSMFSANSTAGIEADPGAFIGVDGSLISSNTTGVLSGGTIAISNSNINSNNTAISGPTRSFGNNRLFANISDGTPPTPFGATSAENGER